VEYMKKGWIIREISYMYYW